MSDLKPFQQATVDVVLKAFHNRNKVRRFLVADEVGLGKTLVAQEVIRRSFKRGRPLVVFYVCSNLTIASQNRAKLLEILDPDQRSSAACPVDRLTLLPAAELPSHPKLHLFTLTPETSIPIRYGRRRDGRQEERALIHALVAHLWPRFLEERGQNFFRRQAYVWWDNWVRIQQQKIKTNGRLITSFHESVRTEFDIPIGHRVVTQLRKIQDPLEIIAHFRNALAASAIEDIRPDIVIFDEFQRFRDLLSPEIQGPSARVIHRLRGERSNTKTPSLLLLSATPYRLYARRWEEEDGATHHHDFFDLVEFLYGNDKSASQQRHKCQAEFSKLADEIRLGQPLSEMAKKARESVETVLRPIMARTERASHPDGWVEQRTIPIGSQLSPYDLKVFRHLSDSLDARHQSSAVHYWNSIPLPMQTMGNNYRTWRDAQSLPPEGTPNLTSSKRNRFTRLRVWPHPRLRALIEQISPSQLALPWSRPSLPWWPLKEEWQESDSTEEVGVNGKLLIFSKFRAVPQTVAALLSYEMEANQLHGNNLSYPDVTSRKRLQPGRSRHNLLALFHPSPWLGTIVDPLAASQSGQADIHQTAENRLATWFTNSGVQIINDSDRRPTWQLIARIEQLSGSWNMTINGWRQIHQETRRLDDPEAGLGALLSDWETEAVKPLLHITAGELTELAEYSLNAPGVVLGRSLRRHWELALENDGFKSTLDLAWNGLRTYLDQHWFAMLLGEENYPKALQRAVLSGNLEAVLDEHLWIIQEIRGIENKDLAKELRQALNLRSSPFYFHRLGRKDASTFSLRCHAAMPFIQSHFVTLLSDDEEVTQTLRTDELRRSFNSPFWPHVLATTSVGQEGLDFHVWCRNILHWDLSGNPVDMEQREGRILRFGGLSVRRAIAKELGEDALRIASDGSSPWKNIANLANKKLTDESGLEPWWIYGDSGINRYVFDIPLSEQAHHLNWLREQRLLYRLVLGLPHQEEFIEILSKKTELDPDDLRTSVLNLSPWFY